MFYDDGAAHYAEELKRQQDEINIETAIEIFDKLKKKAASPKVRKHSKLQSEKLNNDYFKLTGKNYGG